MRDNRIYYNKQYSIYSDYIDFIDFVNVSWYFELL